jgi:hypothetical protein
MNIQLFIIIVKEFFDSIYTPYIDEHDENVEDE